MKNGKLQCKDIPTLPVLEYVAEHGGIGCVWWESEYGRSVRTAMPPGTPEKLVLAKMRNLIQKGLVDGCSCGCRGDFEITDKGRARILEMQGGLFDFQRKAVAEQMKQPPRLHIDHGCAASLEPFNYPWPERWSKKAIEEKLNQMRADPACFASQFIGEPLEWTAQHLRRFLRDTDEPLRVAHLDLDRGSVRTEALVDAICIAVLEGSTVPIRFVFSSEAEAERAMKYLRARLSLLGSNLPELDFEIKP